MENKIEEIIECAEHLVQKEFSYPVKPSPGWQQAIRLMRAAPNLLGAMKHIAKSAELVSHERNDATGAICNHMRLQAIASNARAAIAALEKPADPPIPEVHPAFQHIVDRQAEWDKRIASVVGWYVDTSDGRWVLVGVNDLGVPYFSGPDGGPFRALHGYGMVWLRDLLKKQGVI